MLLSLYSMWCQLCLQWPLAQLFLAAWAGSMGQGSVYLSI
jgi:hypothetical protein